MFSLFQYVCSTSKTPFLNQKYHISLISPQKKHKIWKKSILIPLSNAFKKEFQSHYTNINPLLNSISYNKTLQPL